MADSNATGAQAGSAEAIPPSEAVPGEALPALFANQFYVSITAEYTRLVLGEFANIGSHQTYPRAAFMIPTEDALKLANLILELHANHIASAQVENG